jgi:hypothetical protein
MKKLCFLLGLLVASFAVAQTTVTIPARTIMVPITIPEQTITIPASTAPVTAASVTTAPGPTAPGTAPPVTTAPAAGTFWIYHSGKFKWGGDYSFGSGRVDYATKDPQTGEKVIGIYGDEGLQPYAPGNDFDTTRFNFVVVSVKPTVAGQNWLTGAEMAGDLPIPGGPGQMQSIMPYGPDPAVVGEWNTYKIPFSVYGIKPGLHIYKFAFLQHQQPVPAVQINWYAKDIGVSP